MALTVSIDTYVTIDEADELIRQRFTSTNAQRVAWLQLSTEDKEIMLRNAASEINNVAFSGIKKTPSQALAFPRCFRSQFADQVLWDKKHINGGIWSCQIDTPETVKAAQIFEAVELASPGPDTERFNVYNGVVTNMSITGLSESYVVTSPSSTAALANALRSTQAQQLLSRYVGRYRVK